MGLRFCSARLGVAVTSAASCVALTIIWTSSSAQDSGRERNRRVESRVLAN